MAAQPIGRGDCPDPYAVGELLGWNEEKEVPPPLFRQWEAYWRGRAIAVGEGWCSNQVITIEEVAYQIKRGLGKGAYGFVVKLQEREGEQRFRALKVMHFPEEEEGSGDGGEAALYDRKVMAIEVSFFEQFKRLRDAGDHRVEQIVGYYGAYSIENCPALLLEHCHCSLGRLLSQTAHLTLNTIEGIARGVFLALKHLQSLNIAHRDLTRNNVLLARTETGWQVKLADFGAAKNVGQFSVEFYVTSRWYRAPEKVVSGHEWDLEADWWAGGVLCTELFLSGQQLFEPGDTEGVFPWVVYRLGMPPADFPGFGGDEEWRMWLEEEVKGMPRESIRALVESQYRCLDEEKPRVAQLIEAAEHVVQWNPHARWTPQQVLERLFEEA